MQHKLENNTLTLTAETEGELNALKLLAYIRVVELADGNAYIEAVPDERFQPALDAIRPAMEFSIKAVAEDIKRSI